VAVQLRLAVMVVELVTTTLTGWILDGKDAVSFLKVVGVAVGGV